MPDIEDIGENAALREHIADNYTQQWLQLIHKQWPEAKIELDYKDDFSFVVAVMLSARTTDKSVNQVTPRLFADGATPEALVKLGEDEIAKRISTLGLYRNKAKHLFKMSEILVDLHGGEVPKTREDLEALPGIGRKTANVVLNHLFNIPAIAVDTHVFRVCNRTGLARGKNPEEVERVLMRKLDKDEWEDFNSRVVLHGRYICISRAPKCDICNLRPLCAWAKENYKPARKIDKANDQRSHRRAKQDKQLHRSII